MELPDIYFDPIWGRLYSNKDNGEHNEFLFESQYGKIYYSFIKRPINIKIEEESYFDITSPYGFSGPIVLNHNQNNKEKLLEEFKEAFDIFCIENRIVADSCRFSPWLKNYEDFTHMYELIPNHSTIGIDLSVNNILMDEISSKKRNLIRKAQKSGVKIHFDFEGKYIDEFLFTYNKTILKHNIQKYYHFSKQFLLDNFIKLKGKIFCAYAEIDNNIISIAIFLKGGEYIHYHLAANNFEKYKVPANDLLIYEIAEYGKTNGYKYLMLGGAGGNLAIQHHKTEFTKNTEYPFFKGKRICNPDVYEKILLRCDKVDRNFFPSYR